MGCSGCGKRRRAFLKKINETRQKQIPSVQPIRSVPEKPKTLKELRQDKIAARKLRIARRNARIAARNARIAARNEAARRAALQQTQD